MRFKCASYQMRFKCASNALPIKCASNALPIKCGVAPDSTVQFIPEYHYSVINNHMVAESTSIYQAMCTCSLALVPNPKIYVNNGDFPDFP